MKVKKNFLLLVLAFLCALPLSAKKKFYSDAITMSDIYVWQQSDALTASMFINMDDLIIDRHEALILVPTLTDGQNTVQFPPIIVNGKKKQKEYEKAVKKGLEMNAVVIPYEKREGFIYSQVIPFQAWMGNAAFYLVEQLVGKKDAVLMESQELITNAVSTEAKRLAELMPVVAFIEPVEVDKVVTDVYNTYLDFRLNQATILPNYKNNAKELENIQTLFEKTVGDSNIEVNNIAIVGYASPEGPEGFNEQLSKRRAEALMKYLATKVKDIPATTYTTAFGGENWEGLVIALAELKPPYADSIITIVNTTTDDKLRKEKIKAYDGGAAYKDMLKTIYPLLRNVAISITYTVNNFTTEQALVVMEANPNLLSQTEYYNVAFKHPRGSKKFVDAFEVAQRQAPDDPVANLNVAGAYLTSKDIARAEKAIAKANKKNGEYFNNLGIISFYKGNVKQAIQYFQQAAQLHNQAAITNLSKIMNAINSHQ